MHGRTHFRISGKERITVSLQFPVSRRHFDSDNLLFSLELSTQRLWQRTSALQCCHLQPRVDKMIPIYFTDKDNEAGTASDTSQMSQIFVSDRARERSSEGSLHDITRTHDSIVGVKQPGKEPVSRPYIAILADLGYQSEGRPYSYSFATRGSPRHPKDLCFRIYARGVTSSTYKFLQNQPELATILRDLVHLQQIPEAETPCATYLNAQVKFGSTTQPEHMEWERGQRDPGSNSSSE